MEYPVCVSATTEQISFALSMNVFSSHDDMLPAADDLSIRDRTSLQFA